MSQGSPITLKGHQSLKDELHLLTTVTRPEVVASISEARAHGDLKENAEYHAAKDRQGFIEGRIQEINAKMANCHVIDPQTLSSKKVVFGATVSFSNIETDEEFCYQLVGEDEANLKEGKISYSSPIGRSLIGKTVGDEVIIQVPKGKMTVEITRIQFI